MDNTHFITHRGYEGSALELHHMQIRLCDREMVLKLSEIVVKTRT